MSYRWTESDLKSVQNRPQSSVASLRGSKYRNQKVFINGEKFDSKREAAYYQELLARELAGEIKEIRRQVPFHLCTPVTDMSLRMGVPPVIQNDCDYIADFCFLEFGDPVVVDVKGFRTKEYLLKKKRMWLQYGIDVREVR